MYDEIFYVAHLDSAHFLGQSLLYLGPDAFGDVCTGCCRAFPELMYANIETAVKVGGRM